MHKTSIQTGLSHPHVIMAILLCLFSTNFISQATNSTMVGKSTYGRYSFSLYQGPIDIDNYLETRPRYWAILDGLLYNEPENHIDIIPDYVTDDKGFEYAVVMIDHNLSNSFSHIISNRIIPPKSYRDFTGCIDLSNFDISDDNAWSSVNSAVCNGWNAREIILPDDCSTYSIYSRPEIENCKHLQTLTFHPWIEYIGSLEGCERLFDDESSVLTLSAALKAIPANVLKAQNIHCPAFVPPTLEIPDETYMVNFYMESLGHTPKDNGEATDFYWNTLKDILKNRTLHVPVGRYEAYDTAEGWKYFGTIIDDLDRRGNKISPDSKPYCSTPFIVNNIIYALARNDEMGTYARIIAPYNPSSDYIEIPNSVISPYGKYEVMEFGDCSFMELHDINLNPFDNNNVTKIGDFAFYGAIFHPNINPGYNNNVIETIGNYSFAHNEYSMHGCKLPSTLKRIGNYAFHDNRFYEGSEYTRLPEGLNYIGKYALPYFAPLVIPSSVKTIQPSKADALYPEIEWMPNSEIQSFSDFSNSHYFPTFTVPDHIKSIESHSHIYADTVNLGEFVQIIQPDAIRSNHVRCASEYPPMITPISIIPLNGPIDGKLSDITIHVKKGLADRYRQHEAWRQFGQIIDDIEDEIIFTDNRWTFSLNMSTRQAKIISYDYDLNEEQVVIPESVFYENETFTVTKIAKFSIRYPNGDYADGPYPQYCNSFVIPESIVEIEDFAFYNFPGASFGSPWICKALNPPAINNALAFRWPYQRYILGYLQVPPSSVEAYNNSEWATAFIISETDESSLDSITKDDTFDMSLPVTVYRIDGVKVYEGVYSETDLDNGIYIITQGNKTRKVAIHK